MATKVNNSVFDSLKKYSNIGTKKNSIYKNELLKGTEKERKAIRKKLRNARDTMISVFNAEKNAEKRKAIAKDWIEYAKQVYTDINIICEANTTTDKLVL